MNLYFLVEGKRTEKKVYPKWLETLLPGFNRIDHPSQAVNKNFYVISGYGYPSLLGHLRRAIVDYHKFGKYSYLILCLDADEKSVPERLNEIADFVSREGLSLQHGELRVIVQNRTIETWFLGNRKFVATNSQDAELREFLSFYDVRVRDPEIMELSSRFVRHAQFHEAYVKAAFRGRGLSYTKNNPGDASQPHYLRQLISRVKAEPEHMQSFQALLRLCHDVLQSVDC